MQKTDVCGFVGQWPFRKCRQSTFADLKKGHQEAGISPGYVSSLQSVFWNDPMEAEAELAASLAGSGYSQVCTVNPALPGIEAMINEAAARFHCKAVRICPGYHGYHLDDPRLAPLCRALKKHGLPLYLTARLEDERLNYIVSPRPMELTELRGAADTFDGVRLLYTNLQTAELVGMADLFNQREGLFAETSGLRGPTGCLEYILGYVDSHKILYGSSYTLYTLQSSLCAVERAGVPKEIKERILFHNAQALFEQ